MMTTVPTFTATIYVGVKSTEQNLQFYDAVLFDAVRRFVNNVGLCVTITKTEFVYTGGEERGYAISLINYPRFPSTPKVIKKIALQLAEKLRVACKQRGVSVVMPDETVWITGAPKQCPNCGSENNDPAEGGSETCFHCGDCGWFNCLNVVIGPTKNMKVIYRRKERKEENDN